MADNTARPILFSAPMVRALLVGTKTQTRRIVKPQPPHEEDFKGSIFSLARRPAEHVKAYSANDYDRLPKHPTDWDLYGSVGVARDAGFPNRWRCPYGAPGDLLYVRETWAAKRHEPCLEHERDWQELLGPTIRYAADGVEMTVQGDRATGRGIYRGPVEKIRVSIHMPRWASRLTLEITDVRVERLQDISEADAIAEGVAEPSLGEWVNCGFIERPRKGCPPVTAYAALWDSINGPDSWSANPWVWAVDFKVHETNVDQLLAARSGAPA